MNGYGLTAAIVQAIASLAWPAAIFACVWLFRAKLIELFPALRVKHKDWEASFRLGEAERAAAKILPLPPSPDLEPTPEEKTKFEHLAEISPRAAILEARSDLEEAVKNAFISRGGKVLPNTPNLKGATRVLRASGLIDQATSAVLDDLRAIGNNAAHNRELEFTTEDALRFRRLADQVIQQLNLIQKPE